MKEKLDNGIIICLHFKVMNKQLHSKTINGKVRNKCIVKLNNLIYRIPTTK